MCPSTHSLSSSIMKPLIHTHINSLKHSLNQSVTHSITNSLNHIFTHSFSQSLTYSVHLITIHVLSFSPHFTEMKAKMTESSVCVLINYASALTFSPFLSGCLVGQRKWQYGARTFGYANQSPVVGRGEPLCSEVFFRIFLSFLSQKTSGDHTWVI